MEDLSHTKPAIMGLCHSGGNYNDSNNSMEIKWTYSNCLFFL